MVDINEAPNGYYAVKKPEWKNGITKNYCKSCDWRKDCDGFVMKCHGGSVGQDGAPPRKDGESVIFKRKQQTNLFN